MMSGNVGARGTPSDQESASGLLSRLVNDATALVRNEVALAKSEFRETINTIKIAVGSMATGAAVLIVGLLSLTAAAVLALALVIAPWAAALIVGVVLAVVGLVLLQAGKKKLEPSALSMDRTQDSLRRDAEVIARRS
jgi:VIT1/CCC1 family predicted Fe2+/Mn2+ transporter